MRLIFSPEAEKDVESILRYTLEQWGLKQFHVYKDALNAACIALAEKPNRPESKNRDEIKVGTKSYLVQKHVIFYRVQPGQVEIIRILNQRMDVGRYL